MLHTLLAAEVGLGGISKYWFQHQYFEYRVNIKITILKFSIPKFDIKFSLCQKSMNVSGFDFDAVLEIQK